MQLNDFYATPKESRTLEMYMHLPKIDRQAVKQTALPISQHPFTWPYYEDVNMQDSFSLKNSPLGVYLTQTRPALAVELGSLRISECRVILNKETGLNLPADTERKKGMHAFLAAFKQMDG